MTLRHCALALALALPTVSGADLRASRQQPPTVQEDNDRAMQQVMSRIAGHEKEPAQQVFKNVQIDWLKNVPAQQFLAIMNFGYAKALGVRCSHCHMAEDFASDEKRPKNAAREMAVMHRSVNQQLAQMKNLSDPADGRSINCNTCHRGAINPR